MREDQIEPTDERQRRWFHMRPERRRRMDFWGLAAHPGWMSDVRAV